MRYLLDTNLLSELRKTERANRGVMTWAMTHGHAQSALSVVSVCEVRKGIEYVRERDIVQSQVLEKWLAGVLVEFADNILPVSIEIADLWGSLLAKNKGPERDLLIAATALNYDLTVITRNVDDFAGTGARVYNPWK